MINTSGINFAKQTGIYKEEKKKELFAKGMVVAVFVFLFLGLVSGWVYISKVSQEKKKSELTLRLSEIRKRDYEELAEFMTDSVKLDFLGDFSLKQKLWSGLLGELEKRILVNSYIVDLGGTSTFNAKGFLNQNVGNVGATGGNATVPVATGLGGSSFPVVGGPEVIDLSLIAPTLTDVSKQVVSLKESPAVADLTVIKPSLSEVGISFELKIVLAEGALDRSFYSQEDDQLNIE